MTLTLHTINSSLIDCFSDNYIFTRIILTLTLHTINSSLTSLVSQRFPSPRESSLTLILHIISSSLTSLLLDTPVSTRNYTDSHSGLSLLLRLILCLPNPFFSQGKYPDSQLFAQFTVFQTIPFSGKTSALRLTLSLPYTPNTPHSDLRSDCFVFMVFN